MSGWELTQSLKSDTPGYELILDKLLFQSLSSLICETEIMLVNSYKHSVNLKSHNWCYCYDYYSKLTNNYITKQCNLCHMKHINKVPQKIIGIWGIGKDFMQKVAFEMSLKNEWSFLKGKWRNKGIWERVNSVK